MNELISVYLPTKNRLSTLQRAMASVIGQTYTNFELIVVDDASTDGTWEYLRSIQNDKIKIFRNEVSKGAPFCRNIAIKNAKGRFVTGLDDDDEFLPKRLEVLLDAYDERYAFVFSDYYIQKGNKRYVKKIWKKKHLFIGELYRNGNIVGNQVFSAKEKFLDAGLFDEKLKAAQDYDMWVRLIQKEKIAYHLNVPLMVVHILPNSITNSPNRKKGYRQTYLKHKNSFSLKEKRYHIAGYLLGKNTKFLKFLKFLPCSKRGFVLFVKYIINLKNKKDKNAKY